MINFKFSKDCRLFFNLRQPFYMPSTIKTEAEKYKTESVYDEKEVNQPRLMGTKVYSDVDNNASDDWTEMTTYSCEYGYDEIGRINKKTVGEGVYDYTYLTTGKGGLLPNIQTIKYSFTQASNPSKWTYTHSYDNKGSQSNG